MLKGTAGTYKAVLSNPSGSISSVYGCTESHEYFLLTLQKCGRQFQVKLKLDEVSGHFLIADQGAIHVVIID